jgi:membrane-associated protease RseP (regulator of RpoE activity)
VRLSRIAVFAALLAVLGCGGKSDVYEKKDLGDGSFLIRNPDGDFKYLSAASAKESGIGIRIGKDAQGMQSVLEVFPGSPAQSAGIQVGDKLLSVDGKNLKGLDVEGAAKLIRGKPGSAISIDLERMKEKKHVDAARAKDVMHFTQFPPGTQIRSFSPESGACPKTKEKACHYLIQSGEACFYSCPLPS